MTTKHSGAGWLMNNILQSRDRKRLKVKATANLSPLGRRVADLLGQVYLGLYHLPTSALARANWDNKDWIAIVLPGELATCDGSELTRLVVLCHDAGIRLSISPKAFRYLELQFHQRTVREGGDFWARCPTMEALVAEVRRLREENADLWDKLHQILDGIRGMHE